MISSLYDLHIFNQRTICHVNAHLVSEQILSTKTYLQNLVKKGEDVKILLTTTDAGLTHL